MRTMNLNINNLVLTVVRMVINTLCINRTIESGYANFKFSLVRS
jgi:hypothetical protein